MRSFVPLLFILLSSCSKQSDFIYTVFKKGDKEINLQFPDRRDYLVYDETTPVLIQWKNMDRTNGSVMGAGIRIIDFKDETMITTFTPKKDYVKSDSLLVQFRFDIDGIIQNTSIKIPLREK